MKNKTIGFIAICLSLGLGVGVGYAAAGDRIAYTTEQLPNITQPQLTKQAHYRLSDYDGKVAVYILGKLQPEIVFDIYLHHLPDVDRLKLTEGIYAADYTELLALIEDYTS